MPPLVTCVEFALRFATKGAHVQRCTIALLISKNHDFQVHSGAAALLRMVLTAPSSKLDRENVVDKDAYEAQIVESPFCVIDTNMSKSRLIFKRSARSTVE